MAVAHSAASESHAATTGSVSQTSFSWTHTQTGTPQGVLVFVHVANSTGNPVSSVTYGSVTLERVSGGAAIDSAGEAGRTDLFFAGSGLGTGNQTITVNRANTTDIMYASAATVTAATDTNVTGIVLLEGDGALTVQSVTDGGAPTNSLRYAAAYSGLASPPPAGTGSTLLNSIDFGNYGIALVRETTAGTGARNVGFNNATTDDRAAVHVAVRELWNRTDTQTVGTFTLTGNDATFAKASPKVITGEKGAFTLTGQPASASAGYRVTADLGKFFLPERNTIKQSEQFDDTNNWKIVRANALANNTAAPDGTVTAEFIRETATTGTHVLAYEPNNAIPAVVGPASYTFSCHLKANGRNATLNVNGGGGGGSGASGEVLFDLATGGTTTLTAGTITASGATDLSNGWYRCWITFTTTQAGTCRSDVYLYSGSTSYTGDGTSGIYAWGAQLEQSASLTEYDPTGLGSVTPITFKYNHAITAGTGAFTFTGNDATLTEAAASKVLTAEVGAFAFTGQPATLLKGRTITAETGTITAAGQPATLRHNPRIEANTGSFALSGGAPALLCGRYLSGGSGTFTETGNPASLTQLGAYGIDCTTGAFALSGTAPELRIARSISANVGQFALTGAAASLRAKQSFLLSGLNLVYQGQPFVFIEARPLQTGSLDTVYQAQPFVAAKTEAYLLSADSISFATTSPQATLAKGYALLGSVGAFAATGYSVTLAKEASKQIAVESASFLLISQPAVLRVGRLASADRGLFTLTGQPATLRQDWRSTGELGQFLLSGTPAALTVTRNLLGGTGVFTFTGNPAGLADTDKLAVTPGGFVLTGLDATLAKSRRRNVLIF